MTLLRDAFRALRATPLVTSVALLSLALGIGANSAIFSIADSLLLRALPVRDAERLVLVSATVKSMTSNEVFETTYWTNPIWEAIRDRPTLHDGAFAYGYTTFNLSERGEVENASALRASGGMFRLLGITPLLGRAFDERDDRRGGGPDGAVAMLSYQFWQRRFGAARDVVGRTLLLDGKPVTIVGVTRAEFFGPEVGKSFDVAVPLGALSIVYGGSGLLEGRSSWWLEIMMRLPAGKSATQMTAALRAAQAAIADETRPIGGRPEDAARHLQSELSLVPAANGSSELRKDYSRPVYVLMAIVALTLLIACGNIANLLLARGNARKHEMSVRTALGASAWRLARQLFAESALLSVAGAALGLVFAVWGSRLIISRLSATNASIFLDVGLDWRVVLFTAVLSLATALLFGVIPAVRASRAAPADAMKEHGRSTTSGERLGLAGTLVVGQVAMSLTLLVVAGLLVRSFASLATRELGFERDRALLVTINASRTGLDSVARRAMYARMLDNVRALGGVSQAALSMTTPMGDNTLIIRLDGPEMQVLPEGERIARRNFVSPGWFAAMGTTALSGRDITDDDRGQTRRVAVVNRAFVQKYFRGVNPIGRAVRELGAPNTVSRPIEIIGVVADAVYRTAREAVMPTMYQPLGEFASPPTNLTLVVRSQGKSPAALSQEVSTTLQGVNRDLALSFRPLAEQVDASLARERIVALLSAFFGGLALLLAALGLYGVTAYAVGQRHVELGIRMALGTSPTQAVGLVMRRVVLLVSLGVVIGAVASVWLAQFVESLLYDLAPSDPVTLWGAIAVLGGLSAMAGWLPARRAAKIDPSQLLREH